MARIRYNTGFRDRADKLTTDFAADQWVTFLALGPSNTEVGAYERLGIVKSMPCQRVGMRSGLKWRLLSFESGWFRRRAVEFQRIEGRRGPKDSKRKP
jgi:hypothetical protein